MADQSDIKKLILAVLNARIELERAEMKWEEIPGPRKYHGEGEALGRRIEGRLKPDVIEAEFALADYVVNHAPWIIEVVSEASKR